jgi:hypothetical protein
MTSAFTDLSGQRFGKLAVLRPLPERSNKAIVYACRCDCGKEHKARSTALRHGQVKSCGCEQYSGLGQYHPPIDLTGIRFGELVAVEYSHTWRNGRYWKCTCDCGGVTVARAKDLNSGNTKSCGCMRGRASVFAGGRQ